MAMKLERDANGMYRIFDDSMLNGAQHYDAGSSPYGQAGWFTNLPEAGWQEVNPYREPTLDLIAQLPVEDRKRFLLESNYAGTRGDNGLAQGGGGEQLALAAGGWKNVDQSVIDRLTAGMDPATIAAITASANQTRNTSQGIADSQDSDWLMKNGWTVPLAMMGAGALTAGGVGAAGAAEAAGSASAGGTAAAAGAGAAGAGEAASFLGPATGSIETAPVIGAAGAPTVSGLATGGGPFISTALGAPAASAASRFLDSSASTGSSVPGGIAEGLTLNGLLRGIPGVLGAFGANQQANRYGDLADRYFNMGEPYRGRLAELYRDPSAFLKSPEVTIPIQQGTDMTARALSTTGNPTGSGNALQAIQSYASGQLFGKLGQEKDRLAGFGGLSTYNAAAPGAAGAEINAQGNVLNAAGAAANDIFNAPKSLIQILKEARSAGLY